MNGTDGVVDSIKYLLCHENYVKPWTDEIIFVSLFTRAFWVFLCFYLLHFLIYICDNIYFSPEMGVQ
jgi:isoprenylcysteine carboxyl methyltransferase (ICMT) family protein YpbQ